MEYKESHEVYRHKWSAASSVAYFLNFPKVVSAAISVFAAFYLTNKLEKESTGDDPKKKGLKNCSAVSKDKVRTSKAARTEASSYTHRLEGISVLRRRVGKEKKGEVDCIMRAQDGKDGLVLPLVWANPVLMAYIKLRTKFLDAREIGALPSHGWASEIIFDGRSRATMYEVWRLNYEKWGTVKEHTEERMNMPVLRDESEAVYVFNPAKVVRDFKVGGHPDV